MGHYLIRALILPDIIRKIEEKYNTEEDKALHIFYHSNVGRNFSEDDSGLYGQSPNFIFSLFVQEMTAKENII